MESTGDWEVKLLLNELTQGHDFAKQLQNHLGPSSPPEVRESLLQKILSSYSTALAILRPTSSGSHAPPPAVTAGIDSPHSVSESLRSESTNQIFADPGQEPEKRKTTLPKWTEQVRVSGEIELESPVDGYSWRKYGQKDILGAKYPRSYYRCSRRNIQGCPAKKQVQRSAEDPTVFHVTYRGKHTCGYQYSNEHHANRTPSSPSAPLPPPPPPMETLLSFKNNLTVKTEGLETGDLGVHPFSFPPASTESTRPERGIFSPSGLDTGDLMVGFSNYSFTSPATSECNYFPLPPRGTLSNLKEGSNMQTSGSEEMKEIVSASTSVPISPMVDLDFSLDLGKLDPDFPFDASGFFLQREDVYL